MDGRGAVYPHHDPQQPPRRNGVSLSQLQGLVVTASALVGLLGAGAALVVWLSGGLGPGEHAAAIMRERIDALDRRTQRLEQVIDTRLSTHAEQLARVQALQSEILSRLAQIERELRSPAGGARGDR